MTKSEFNEANKVMYWASLSADYIDTAALSISSLIRSTKTTKSRNELILIAAGIPAVVQSSEWII
jgi:hypothetical protein